MKRRTAAVFAGTIWVSGGIVLVVRSIDFIGRARDDGATTALILAACLAGIVLGAGKGIFVLAKSARRNLARLETLDEPVAPWRALPAYLYVLIPVMVGMGVGIRWLAGNDKLPGGWTTAAAVYLGIGAALFASGLVYFKKKIPSS